MSANVPPQPVRRAASSGLRIVLGGAWAVLAVSGGALALTAIRNHGIRVETMVFVDPTMDGSRMLNLTVASIGETLLPLLLALAAWLVLQFSGRHWLKSMCGALGLSVPVLALLYATTLFLPTFDILHFDDYRTLMEPLLRNPKLSVALLALISVLPLFILVGLVDMVVAYIVGWARPVPAVAGEPGLEGTPSRSGAMSAPLLVAAVGIVAVVGICLASVVSFAVGSRAGTSSSVAVEDVAAEPVTGVAARTGNRTADQRAAAERAAAEQAAQEQARREAAEKARREAEEQARREAEQRARAQAWNDVYRYVQTVGTGLDNEITAVPEVEYHVAYTRDSTRMRTLQSYSFEDMDLESLRIASALELGSSLSLLGRIGEVQGNKPTGDEMLFSGMNALAEGFQNRGSDYKEFNNTLNAFHTLSRSIQAETRLEELQKQYRDQDWKTRWVFLDGIKPLADRFDGPTNLSSLGISYLPSWHGAYPQDIVGMTNNTGVNLTNAVVYVSVSNGDRRTDHVHHIASWPAGATRYGAYRYWVDDYQSSMTRPNVNSIVVNVHTASHSGTFSRTLSASEIDDTIRSYCKDLKFLGGYLPASQNFWTGSQPQGVSFSFTGLGRLPVNRVDVDFQSGSRTDGVWWDYKDEPSLRSGKDYEFRSTMFDFAPQKWTVTLGFAGTSYKHVVEWSR